MNYYKHNFDPILLTMGPLQIRWYGLMYLTGFAVGFLFLLKRHKKGLFVLNSDQIQSLITYLIIGMIFGSRLIYVTVYNPHYYLENPSEIPAIWKGGLSYHGAALGFIGAVILYGRHNKLGFFHLMDNVVFGAALGVIFGRFGNFINGELYGRVTDVPWGVIFPQGGAQPRHPSQLYQSFAEGFCVLIALIFIEKWERKKGFAPPLITPDPTGKIKKYQIEWKRTGIFCSSYLILYGVARFIIEFFREPDSQLGFYFRYFSMGQILCFVMIISGIILLMKRTKNPIPIQYIISAEEAK